MTSPLRSYEGCHLLNAPWFLFAGHELWVVHSPCRHLHVLSLAALLIATTNPCGRPGPLKLVILRFCLAPLSAPPTQCHQCDTCAQGRGRPPRQPPQHRSSQHPEWRTLLSRIV